MTTTQDFIPPKLPMDKFNFVKSFDVHKATSQDLSNFYHQYGFLIFRDILNEQEIQKTIDDLWNDTIQYHKQRNVKIDRKNQKTWGNLKGFHKAFGFVNDSILEQPQIWQNRKNAKVYSAFKRSFEANIKKPLNEPLICCFDRGSLMLPSKLNPDWQTSDVYHFDIDPQSWTKVEEREHFKYDYNPDALPLLLGQNNYDPFMGYTKFAGVLALSDTNQESGGFSCPPGFQNYIKTWCEKNPKNFCLGQDKNLISSFQKVFMRKGSLLVFSRELPHNIYQNVSDKFRYAQYLRMTPLSTLCLTPQLEQARKKLVSLILPKTLDVSDQISQEIFMLDPSTNKKINQALTNQPDHKQCSIY